MWEIPGVEYVYSTSQPGRSLIVVRFRVGEDAERSLVKLYQKLQANADRIPPGASPPLVKARSIDDVPILALTFHSSRYDHLTLAAGRRAGRCRDQARARGLGDHPHRRLPAAGPDPSRPGRARRARAGRLDVLRALGPANRQEIAGALTTGDRDVIVQTGAFFTSADDVASAVVGVHAGSPVYLRDVAEVTDGVRGADAVRPLRHRGGQPRRAPPRSRRSRSPSPSGRGATPSPWPGPSWPRSSA